MKEETIKFEGIVTDVLPNNMFKVQLEEVAIEVITYLNGKMRQNKIKVLRGDKVEVEMTPYDTTRGRIIFRHR